MNLCIDIGNTRTKLGIFKNEQMAEVITPDVFEEQDLKNILEQYEIKRCVVSSTVSIPEFIPAAVSQLHPNIFLDKDTALPFSNLYHSPETLGKDRIALAAAACARYPGKDNLVIGCGTCITFNFMNAQNEFIGGSIHPGLKMRLQAMHSFTGKLPLIALENDIELIAKDTRSNMLTGVLFAAAKEIDGMIDEYLVKFPQMNVIITGGDAELLVYRLKNEIFAIPNFTLVGLNHILEYNA
jgi:type III pantothenate kinase